MADKYIYRMYIAERKHYLCYFAISSQARMVRFIQGHVIVRKSYMLV